MRKIFSLVLIGIICFAPALVAAQATSGGTTTGAGAGSKGGATSSGSSTGSSGSGSMSTPPSSGSSTSPSASPSSLSKIDNQADCVKAGGVWQASTKMCEAKK